MERENYKINNYNNNIKKNPYSQLENMINVLRQGNKIINWTNQINDSACFFFEGKMSCNIIHAQKEPNKQSYKFEKKIIKIII